MVPDLDLTRRQAIVGGGVVVALVGGGLGASHLLRGASYVSPDVPTEALQSDGWTLVDETREVVLDSSAGPVTVRALASSVQYEDHGLAERVRDTDVEIQYRDVSTTRPLGEFVGDEFGQTLGVFAATKIDVTPHLDELPGGIGRGEIMTPVREQAQATFEDQLRSAGLENVRQVATTTLDIDSGETADLYEYDATFRFESTAIEESGVSAEIPATDMEIAGYLAVWHTGANVLVAAGAHPNDNYADTITDTSGGDEVQLTFDLGLEPSQMREDLLGYIAAVE